jgi:glycosyltransferase involved in cell wall biosynthesis
MSDSIVLSYVISTRNKLPYLKTVLRSVIDQKKEDEEIIVVDGASDDGTSAYLKELFLKNLIQQFISEADQGEAHGTNKAMLMAKGRLIKIITDDDAFYFPAIQKCKEFMLAYSSIDALGTEGAGTGWQKDSPIGPSNYQSDFQGWLRFSKPFAFCGLGLMLRRSSLSLTGLLHSGFKRVDYEFAMRLTAGSGNIAWYTGFAWVRIANSNSVSQNNEALMHNEGERIDLFYLHNNDYNIKYISKSVQQIFKNINSKFRISKTGKQNIDIKNKIFETDNWQAKFNISRDWLLAQDIKMAGNFLYRNI